MKKKLSKRGALFLANGIFAGIWLIVYFLYLFSEGYYNYNVFIDFLNPVFEMFFILFCFVLAQCVFTFLTLIVYYLSIMADALNKKYKEQEDKEKN